MIRAQSAASTLNYFPSAASVGRNLVLSVGRNPADSTDKGSCLISVSLLLYFAPKLCTPEVFNLF